MRSKHTFILAIFRHSATAEFATSLETRRDSFAPKVSVGDGLLERRRQEIPPVSITANVAI
jgi:hypothetical protein